MAFGDFTVVRSTVKNVLGSNGLIGQVAINTPAFEFNADGSYKGLLVEPGATNLTLNSNVADASTGTTVSANATTAPDGTTTMDKLVEDVSNGVHQTAFSTTLGGSVDSSIYTVSLFVKAGERTRIQLLDNNQNTSGATIFDLSNGTVVSGTGTIEDYGGGIYRCSIFPLKNFSTTSSVLGRMINTGTNTSYTGDGTSGLFLWGKQVEAGSVATSPIPTVASTVARTADNISLSSASSLIGQTEGTIYLEAETRIGGSGQRLFEINDATSDNRITCIVESNFTISTVVTVGGVGTASYTGATESNTIKVALAYANNDIATYVNAVANGTDTSSAIPATSVVYLGSTITVAHLNGWIKSFALFPTRLANATLASLTTL
jgi:hypothetical protein